MALNKPVIFLPVLHKSHHLSAPIEKCSLNSEDEKEPGCLLLCRLPAWFFAISPALAQCFVPPASFGPPEADRPRQRKCDRCNLPMGAGGSAALYNPSPDRNPN